MTPSDYGFTSESVTAPQNNEPLPSRQDLSQAEEALQPFFIVGIGASAGGLEALETLFERMPEDTGLAFVVVQHLSPDFQSHMDQLLQRKTRIPVQNVEDGMRVVPNCIYLIPAKKEMIISGGRLLLTDKDPQRGLSMPIDSFLRSLAQDAGRQAVAVILSGTGSDGSRGIKQVHEAGGLIIVQDEETAQFNGMPLAAMDTGVVDLILPPQAIPAALRNHACESRGAPAPRSPAEKFPALDEGLERIIRLLHSEYGIDFNDYKVSTVMRRTERRRALTRSESMEDYARSVESDPKELDALYRDLLIGVTTFFRDADSFESLARDVVVPLLSQVDRHDEIRVWVPGCATGEEAYSLAMLFHEQLEAANRPLNLKIFATDVHRESLEFAGAGAYSEEQLGEITQPRRERYFTRKKQRYHVVPELRELIVFAPHNVITAAPFTKMHLISCRNMLIYFQPMVQKKVLCLFHFGLVMGGYLFLGSSENLGELREEFESVDKHWRIYRKRRDVQLPARLKVQVVPAAPAVRRRDHSPEGPLPRDGRLIGHYDALLNRHMPPSILIDENYQLLHTFGGAERFLQVKAGRSPANVLEMLDKDLKTAVAAGLKRLKQEDTPIRYTGVRTAKGEGAQHLKLTLESILPGPKKPGSFLVTFEPMDDASDTARPRDADYDVTEMTREQIEGLESELQFTKENLQATIEELETSNEELQAANEELVASNEELQSTNEELQSVNEELYTVNAEHQRKITELTEMTDDMHNLLESTDVGVIYLDRDLRIRRFTPRMAESFNLLPHDVGRRIDHFAHTIEDRGLMEDVRSVLETEQGIEKQVRDKTGVPYFLRILPYQTQTRVAGVVLTLIEISNLLKAEEDRQAAEAGLLQSEVRKKAILDSALDAIITLDPEGKILEFNPAAEKMFGHAAENVIGESILPQMFPSAPRDHQPTTLLDFLKSQASTVANERFEWIGKRKDGTAFPCELTLTQISSDDGPPLFTAFVRDITARIRAEQAIRERETQFRGTFENAAVGIAHKDMEGRWLRVNDRLCEIAGYTREEMTKKTFHDITHPDDLQADLDQFQRLRAGEMDSYKMEKRYIRKDGCVVWVELTSSMQRDDEGRPLYCIAVIQDISRRKQIEMDLQSAIQARESFLAMLSHELRNPLSAVLNATRLLRRGRFNASGFSRDDVTSVIERQAQQMAKLLADLLDVSRINKGKIELECQRVDLCELMHSVKETVMPTLREHEIALNVRIPDGPVWVQGDPTRLQQIQVNLLCNAAKYSAPGSHVQFIIEAEDDEAVIRVRDKGVGIPAHLLEKIFEPFVQSEETLHRSEGGLGIGLTLVSSLVKLHGGQVTAQSAGRGKGSEFLIRLPRIPGPAEEEAPRNTAELASVSKPLKIVLVEDQADNAQLLKAHLEMDGHQVSLAFDGEEGLERVLKEQPDCAIMDIGIPKLNGYQVAEQVRHHSTGKNILLIALTGYGQPADVSRARESGFHAHLVKPLDLTKLRELLAKPKWKRNPPE